VSGVTSAFAVVLLLAALLWLHQMYLRQMPIEIRGLLISIAAIVGLILLSLVGIMAEPFGELALILFAIFALWALLKRYWRNLVESAWIGIILGALIMDGAEGFFADLPPDPDLPADLDRTLFRIGLALFAGAMLITVSTILWSILQHAWNRTLLQAIRSNWYYVFGLVMTIWVSLYLDLSTDRDAQIGFLDAWIMNIIVFVFFTGMAWGADVFVRWLAKRITSEWKKN